jgi:hypothetical protein
VLRGRLHNGCFEEIFTPRDYYQFHNLMMMFVILSGWKFCCQFSPK